MTVMARTARRGAPSGLYGRILDGLGVLAALAYAVAAVVTTLDVALRGSAGITLRGLVDLMEYGLFVTTFLAAPWVLRHNGHVQVDFLVNALPAPAGRLLEGLANVIGLIVSAVLLAFSWQAVAQAHAQGTLVFKAIVFPEWWVLSALPVSCLLLTVEFLRRLLLTGRRGDQRGDQRDDQRTGED